MDKIEKTTTEKAIGEVIQSLFANLNTESREKYGEQVNEIFNSLTEKNNLKSMDNFHFSTTYEFEEILDLLLKKIYPNLTEEQFSKVSFIYLNHSFFKNQVHSLIKIMDGWVCSSDKTRWIMENYLHYVLTGKFEEKTNGEKTYWEPLYGTSMEWMEFCEGVRFLYYGKVDKFLVQYGNLIKCEHSPT